MLLDNCQQQQQQQRQQPNGTGIIMTAQLRGLDDDEATVPIRQDEEEESRMTMKQQLNSPGQGTPLAALLRSNTHLSQKVKSGSNSSIASNSNSSFTEGMIHPRSFFNNKDVTVKGSSNNSKNSSNKNITTINRKNHIINGGSDHSSSSSSSSSSSLQQQDQQQQQQAQEQQQEASTFSSSQSKRIRFLTEGRINFIPRIPKSKRAELWWSKAELEELYDKQLEELQSSSSVEEDYKHVLRTAYLSCKDDDIMEENVSMCFHSMYQCSHVRGLENEVLPQLKYYKKKHRRAVLAAYEAVAGAGALNKETKEKQRSLTQEEQDYVRTESLNMSRSCRLVSIKMGEFDQLVANKNVALLNRTPSGRWDESDMPLAEETPKVNAGLPQRMTSYDSIAHRSASSSEETIYLTPSPTRDWRRGGRKPSALADPAAQGALPRPPLASPPGSNESNHGVNVGRDRDRMPARPGRKNLRDLLLREDSGDLMQPDNRRGLLRQSSARILALDDEDDSSGPEDGKKGEDEEGSSTVLKTSKNRRSLTRKGRPRRRSKLTQEEPTLKPTTTRQNSAPDIAEPALDEMPLPPRRRSAGDTAPKSVRRNASPQRRSTRGKLILEDPEADMELQKLRELSL